MRAFFSETDKAASDVDRAAKTFQAAAPSERTEQTPQFLPPTPVLRQPGFRLA
jgi:hypothetical protein